MDETDLDDLCNELGLLVLRGPAQDVRTLAKIKEIAAQFERATTDRFVDKRRSQLLLNCAVWFSGHRSSRSVGTLTLAGLFDDIAKLHNVMQNALRRERLVRGIMH
jgi:hypothetical protein